MASYLDQQPLQLPAYKSGVDEQFYTQALQYKKAEYDKGFQKVQSFFDTTSSLPILKDVDKKYVQDKLQGISDNLRQGIATDWSNQALVNQTGSMVGQITQDPRVKQMVQSSQGYKSLVEDQAAKEKDGKYSEGNRNWDNRAASEYLNDPEVGAVYKGPHIATPIAPYAKDLEDVYKNITPDKNVTLTRTDPYTLVQTKTEMVRPEVVKDAYTTYFSSNPAAQKQREIDAWNTYQGLTKEGIISQHDALLAQLEQQTKTDIEQLQDQIKISPFQPKQVKDLQDMIVQKTQHLMEVSRNNEDFKASILDPNVSDDTLKTKMLQDLQIQDAVSRKSVNNVIDRSIIEDPSFKGRMDEANYNLKLQENQMKNYHWNLENGISNVTGQPAKLGDADYFTVMAVSQGKAGANSAANPYQPGSTTAGDVNGVKKFDIPGYLDKKQNLEKDINSEKQRLFEQWQAEYLNKDTTKTPLTPAQLEQKFLQEEVNFNQGTPKNIDPLYKTYKNNIKGLEGVNSSLQSLFSVEQDKANKAFPLPNVPISISLGRNPNTGEPGKLVINPQKDAPFIDAFNQAYHRSLRAAKTAWFDKAIGADITMTEDQRLSLANWMNNDSQVEMPAMIEGAITLPHSIAGKTIMPSFNLEDSKGNILKMANDNFNQLATRTPALKGKVFGSFGEHLESIHSQINAPINNTMAQRVNALNSALAEKGKAFAPSITLVNEGVGDPEKKGQEELKARAIQSLQASGGMDAYNKKTEYYKSNWASPDIVEMPKSEDVVVRSVETDNGRQYYNLFDKKSNKTYKVLSVYPIDSRIPNKDITGELAWQSLQTGVPFRTSSEQGKIHAEITPPGALTRQVGVNLINPTTGAKINIPGKIRNHTNDMSSIQQVLNVPENKVNPQTGNYYTSEEIYKIIQGGKPAEIDQLFNL